MKKFVLLILVGLLVTLALAACGKSNCKHDDPSQIVTVKTVNPTCQRTGLTAGKKCNICGTYVIPQEILPVKDCIESEWIVDKEPTKTEDGIKHTECTMCGKLFQEVTIYAGSQGLIFYLNSDGQSYSVDGIGTCTDSDVVIPRQYNGLPVTNIDNSAFSGCTSLTSVTIGNSVTSIDHHAFYGCSSLENITIGNSVTSIGYGAFADCTSLKSVIIPNSVTSIVSNAFGGCTSLKSVIIPNSVTSIGEFAFGGCTSLTLYCEAIFAPAGWIYYWDNLHSDAKIPVVWGYKGN